MLPALVDEGSPYYGAHQVGQLAGWVEGATVMVSMDHLVQQQGRLSDVSPVADLVHHLTLALPGLQSHSEAVQLTTRLLVARPVRLVADRFAGGQALVDELAASPDGRSPAPALRRASVAMREAVDAQLGTDPLAAARFVRHAADFLRSALAQITQAEFELLLSGREAEVPDAQARARQQAFADVAELVAPDRTPTVGEGLAALTVALPYLPRAGADARLDTYELIRRTPWPSEAAKNALLDELKQPVLASGRALLLTFAGHLERAAAPRVHRGLPRPTRAAALWHRARGAGRGPQGPGRPT